MPYRSRRTYRGRRTFRRTRLYGRSRPTRKYSLARRFYRRRRQGPAKWYGQRLCFREKFEGQLVTFNNPANYGTGLSLQINNCPLWTSRQTLGDQYKIYKWKVEVIPQHVVPPLQSEANLVQNDFIRSGWIRHALVPDYTDDGTPASWDQMIEHPYAHPKPFTRPLKLIIRPKVALMAYETATTTGYKTGTGWISRADPTVKHYGFKYMVNASDWHPAMPGNIEFSYRLRHTVYYGIKNVQCTL